MTLQINGMVKERLLNCDTHFDFDQIKAIMGVIGDSGYSDLYEALKALMGGANYPSRSILTGLNWRTIEAALAKAGGK